jgi:feruloyl-CoA synthase
VLSDLLGHGAPDAVALIDAGGTSLTYAALGAAVARAADDLAALGPLAGHRVGVAVAEPAAFLVAALAVWRAGGALVPLDLRAGAAGAAAAGERARALAIVTAASLDGGLRIDLSPSPPDPGDPRVALVLFTSGSSGRPKGVLLGAAGIAANVEAILGYLPVRAAPRTAVVLPLHYSYALVGQALTTLRAGGSLLLLGDVPFPAHQLDAMARHGAEGLSSVPTSLRLLARAAAEIAPAARPPLRYWASAGAHLDARTLAELRGAFPGARSFNQYGLTEASPRVAALADDDDGFARGSAGRALPGIELQIRDESGAPVPAGVAGALHVRGPSVMLGYLDDAEATVEALAPDGWLRTHDEAHLDDDGRLFVHGRTDGVVKCAGERVSVEEVAAVLREAPGVRDAAVVAIADATMGARLFGFVEAAPEGAAAAVAHARARLAPARRPTRIVALAALPRTANGKVAVVALRALVEKA